jgi:CubicO group peptidase (beta-lactamase class C family)
VKKVLQGALLLGVALASWLVLTTWTGFSRIPDAVPFRSVPAKGIDELVVRFADDMVRRARKELGVVGLSAAVSVEGRVVWAAAAGYADLETRRALHPDSMLRIGSTSKAVTATLLARLVDEGVVDLDTPIERYMKVPNPQWAPLTPRQLASHTAGLPGYEENTDLPGLYQTVVMHRRYDDVVDALDIFDGTSLLYEPGTAFHYSSFDVNLLSAALQGASQRPFLDILQERVLGPLKMTSTAGDGHVSEGRVASFYELRAGGQAKPWRRVDLTQKLASGGLLSTPSDLARLCGGWFDPAFLRPETVKAFWEPQRLRSGAVNDQAYAIGWRASLGSEALGSLGVTDRFHHGGVSKGAMSWLVCYPERRLGIALSVNSLLENFDDLARMEPPIAQWFAGTVGKPLLGGTSSRSASPAGEP